MNKYDCIVIGSGHAGIEASHSAAKLGCDVLLLTTDIDAIGKLSCNPAIGGVSKGHLVREVDALGGLIGRIADECALSYRILNRSKGKAVWSTRAQVDMFAYPNVAGDLLKNIRNIKILQAKVKKIIIKEEKVRGVETNFGEFFAGRTVLVCAGTFLKSKIHIGLNSFPGGRLYEGSSDSLFESIKEIGFQTTHFKTGTCARLDKRTIDFSKVTEQFPDKDVTPFSFLNKNISKKLLSCFLTYTNKKTHKIIKDNLKYSPLYAGKIKSRGVRYCPSLEDKVVKFFDKDRHRIFIEPAGRYSLEVYPNGISTSLPFDIQKKFINTIEGFEKAEILRPGYGIEHGVVDSRQLYPTLESKLVEGLYFAGQINGTTGYEEAAAQGVIAGINAGLKIKKEKPFIVRRDMGYIGVLIDDLTVKGTDEPYRMFTSRSEFRISLRESNSDLRLAPFAYSLGLLSKEEYQIVLDKKNLIKEQVDYIKTKKIIFDHKKMFVFDVLKRPKIDYNKIKKHLAQKNNNVTVQREVEIEVKYEGFLRREGIWLRELKNLDKIKIPRIDYSQVMTLSKEIVEKLEKFKPGSLGEALNISGVTPVAILSILNFIKKRKKTLHKGLFVKVTRK